MSKKGQVKYMKVIDLIDAYKRTSMSLIKVESSDGYVFEFNGNDFKKPMFSGIMGLEVVSFKLDGGLAIFVD